MSCGLSNLTEGGVSDIIAIDVKGLVNVVPRNVPGDKAKEYCINGFAIDNYCALLAERQRFFPKWCRHSLFAKTTELIRPTHFTFHVFLCFCGPLCLNVRVTIVYECAFVVDSGEIGGHGVHASVHTV